MAFWKNYPEIGNIKFVRRRNAKNIKLSIKPFQEILVSFPTYCDFENVEKFVFDNSTKIKIHKDKIRKIEKVKSADSKNDSVDIEKKLNSIISRFNQFVEKYNFHVNKLSFRNQKTIWGSCSSQNNISLNVKLVKLPQNIQDYVILHELMHTRVKNHSNIFWQELEKILPQTQQLRKELKQFSPIFI